MEVENDYDKLYRIYFMEVYSYVMTIIKSADQAEEITQETFFRAMKSKSGFKGNSSEFTWLCAIAKNLCLDVLRKQNRYDTLDEDTSSNISIETIVEDKDATLKIHQVLHKLEEPYKEVFHMRVFGELSFKDIGTIFSKTENWARVTYHRARIKIQEQM